MTDDKTAQEELRQRLCVASAKAIRRIAGMYGIQTKRVRKVDLARDIANHATDGLLSLAMPHQVDEYADKGEEWAVHELEARRGGHWDDQRGWQYGVPAPTLWEFTDFARRAVRERMRELAKTGRPLL